jgi:hypothetical protein
LSPASGDRDFKQIDFLGHRHTLTAAATPVKISNARTSCLNLRAWGEPRNVIGASWLTPLLRDSFGRMWRPTFLPTPTGPEASNGKLCKVLHAELH